MVNLSEERDFGLNYVPKLRRVLYRREVPLYV